VHESRSPRSPRFVFRGCRVRHRLLQRFITNTDGLRSQTISDASSYTLNKTQGWKRPPHEDSDSRINGLAETVADEGEHYTFWSAHGVDSVVPSGPEIKGSSGCWRKIGQSSQVPVAGSSPGFALGIRFLKFGPLSPKKDALGRPISHVLDSSHTRVPPNSRAAGFASLIRQVPSRRRSRRPPKARQARRRKVEGRSKRNSWLAGGTRKPSSSTFLSLPERRDSGQQHRG
jgi:hypothetical protein